DACGSYRAMLAGLEEMERDLHEHIHKENNVLFPQVLELEARVAGV
ncbi:iron-sulfur cluster repair di-iron protein, partial [Staphylococcus warneri]